MKWLWVLAAAVFGALVGATLLEDPGYLLMRAGSWVFESTIAAGVLSFLLLLSVIWCASSGIRWVLQSLGLIKQWRSARQQDKNSLTWRQGLTGFIRGDWQGAARAMQRIPAESGLYREALMVQAWHAVQINDGAKLAHLFEQAAASSEQSSADLLLTVCRWQLENGFAANARELLLSVSPSTEWAGLFAWSCIELRDWPKLLEHWTAVEKLGVLKAEEFRAQMVLLRAGSAMACAYANKQGNKADWQSALKNLPKQWRTDPKTLGLFAEFLQEAGLQNSAQELLQDVLAKQWQASVVRCYGGLAATGVSTQAIDIAEAWLQKRGDDPELLLALGRLTRAANRLETSRKHLTAAAKIVSSSVRKNAENAELEQLIVLELGKLQLSASGL